MQAEWLENGATYYMWHKLKVKKKAHFSKDAKESFFKKLAIT